MSDRAAFLAKIRDAQTDNTVRLIYADWLFDQPDPADHAHAEFIRLQINECPFDTISLRDVVSHDWRTRHASCAAGRAGAILHDWGLAWRFGGLPVTSELDVGYRRGFVTRLAFDPNHWRDLGDDWVGAEPIEEVSLTAAPDIRRWDHEVQNHQMRRLVFQRVCGWGQRVARFEYHVSEQEIRMSRLGIDHYRALALQDLDDQTQPELVLRRWWPGVRFTLPVPDAIPF